MRPRGTTPGASALAGSWRSSVASPRARERHGDRQIVRREHDGSITVLASHFDGKRLNSPNDLVYGPNGDLYFTDPPYGASFAAIECTEK